MKSICKLFAMILFLTGMLMFMSCSKENKDSNVLPKENKDLILGKWKCTRVQAYWGESTTYGEEGVGDIYEFKSDGKLVITGARDNSTETYTYSINENIINIGGLLSYVIKELTQSKLTMSIEGLVTLYFEKI